MIQLHLFYAPKVSVDGRIDKDGLIEYIGDASYSHGEGLYKCLARVGEALCVVEIQIRPSYLS